MSSSQMSVGDLARYLSRDARELEKLASQGKVPGKRIAGEWRFFRQEIYRWLEVELRHFPEEHLYAVDEQFQADGEPVPLIGRMLDVAAIGWPLQSRTAPKVVTELVTLANHSWEVFDPVTVAAAVRLREEIASTALPIGVALPHPKGRLADLHARSLLSCGYCPAGLPFGADSRNLTDLFFLILCRDDATHLHVLTRLSRMLKQETFLPALRQAQSAAEALDVIEAAELAVLDRHC